MNAKIAYYAIPNPTGTAPEAPALPRVIPNGVANTNDVIADIRNGIATTEARCRIALEAVIAVALEHVRNGETVDLGGFRLRPRIPGSMPCADTPFDFGENTLVVDVLADQELNAALEGLVPYKVDASELTSMIKVSNVTDVATQVIGEIRGTDEFIITGNGVTLDAAGESAKLVDKKSGAELATAEVVSVSKGQRATCKFAAVPGGIARGAYWLVVTTFGLVGETTPRVFRKPVTLVEPIPEPDPLAVSEDGDVKVMTLGTLSNKTPCTMTGTNVGYDDAAENGIYEVRASIGDYGELAFKSSKGGGFGASEVTLTYDPESTSAEELPPPGTYDVLVAFERKGGSEGSEEIVSTRPVRVVID